MVKQWNPSKSPFVMLSQLSLPNGSNGTFKSPAIFGTGQRTHHGSVFESLSHTWHVDVGLYWVIWIVFRNEDCNMCLRLLRFQHIHCLLLTSLFKPTSAFWLPQCIKASDKFQSFFSWRKTFSRACRSACAERSCSATMACDADCFGDLPKK